MGWLSKIKENNGAKGFLPWLSVKIQKALLITAACIGGIVIFASLAGGKYFPLGFLGTILAFLAIYSGLKTKWLKDIEVASKATKIIGAAAIGIASLIVLVGLAYMAIAILIVVLFIAGLVLFLTSWASQKEGKIEGGVGSAISKGTKIHKNFFGQSSNLVDESGAKAGSLEKAWFSEDQIIRDCDGHKIGRISQNAWNRNVQDIINDEGEKVGEIMTNVWGKREIVDGSGNTVGTIEKDIWGDTKIQL